MESLGQMKQQTKSELQKGNPQVRMRSPQLMLCSCKELRVWGFIVFLVFFLFCFSQNCSNSSPQSASQMKKQQQTTHSLSRPILSHPSYPSPPLPSTASLVVVPSNLHIRVKKRPDSPPPPPPQPFFDQRRASQQLQRQFPYL